MRSAASRNCSMFRSAAEYKLTFRGPEGLTSRLAELAGAARLSSTLPRHTPETSGRGRRPSSMRPTDPRAVCAMQFVLSNRTVHAHLLRSRVAPLCPARCGHAPQAARRSCVTGDHGRCCSEPPVVPSRQAEAPARRDSRRTRGCCLRRVCLTAKSRKLDRNPCVTALIHCTRPIDGAGHWPNFARKHEKSTVGNPVFALDKRIKT